MIKIICVCTLLVCVLSAPTSDKPNENQEIENARENQSTGALTRRDHSQVGSDITPSTDKRDKREELPASDKKRTQINSQPEYEENKPPTFVFPVPVDQIIKNSHAAPEIHSSHKSDVEKEDDVEEESKPVDDGENTEERGPAEHLHHLPTYKRKPSTNTAASDEENREN